MRASISSGRAVLEVLRGAGVDHIFSVPGESFAGLTNAAYDMPSMRFISTRHEEGAAFMASAYARLTGRPALCAATRMVGAGHASIGVHAAQQDSTPLIVVLGQVATEHRYREAFQEGELATIFGEIAKWSVEPPSADRLVELTTRAVRIAVSGRPGPVVISIREDLLDAQVPAPELRPIEAPRPAPAPGVAEEILRMARAAEAPALLVGEGVLAAGASELCVRFAEREQIPVFTAWRRPDAFPNEHPLYLGWAGLRSPTTPFERLQAADLILAIGTRLDGFSTYNYALPAKTTQLIHVDRAAEGLGSHIQAQIACLSDAGIFFEAILEESDRRPPPAETTRARTSRNARDRQTWEAATTPSRGKARDGYVDQQVVASHLQPFIDRGGVLVMDAGNFSGWPSRYLKWREPGTFLGSSSGSMGYGIPAAIGARLARPDRPVVCVVGDGGFLMTGSELETAVRESIPIVVLVFDNQQYGTIRHHQEQHHPGRAIGMKLGSVDFVGYATALGAQGILVTSNEHVKRAIDDGVASGEPTVIHLRIDPEQLYAGDDEPR